MFDETRPISVLPHSRPSHFRAISMGLPNPQKPYSHPLDLLLMNERERENLSHSQSKGSRRLTCAYRPLEWNEITTLPGTSI
jgi:hypothetical protein